MLDVTASKVTYSSRSRVRTQSNGNDDGKKSESKTCTVKELLEGFVAVDVIEGFFCDKCRKHTTAHRRMAFSRLPNVRFMITGLQLRKAR